jgi:hypothetical protein
MKNEIIDHPKLNHWRCFAGTRNGDDEEKFLTLEMLIGWTNGTDPMIECIFCGDTKPYLNKELVCYKCLEYKGIIPYIPE